MFLVFSLEKSNKTLLHFKRDQQGPSLLIKTMLSLKFNVKISKSPNPNHSFIIYFDKSSRSPQFQKELTRELGICILASMILMHFHVSWINNLESLDGDIES